ncbi:hypothetical protein [Herbiconiux ginsengi]|uniref:Uncharacterized protein n=1 Tax=Herbiconiux ginsengi TaxID=381665 RepID=A0A1H3KLT9_9MICO|nr:hypothetical protein [Herbiconiux ginsengi]SDY52695.1 hypothetical protein SAMN05216554_0600 [Herbiconiux ginsengi]
MTAGENIKKGAENTKNVTDKVVDAVEEKVNQVTDAVEGAFHKAGDKIHAAASQDTPHQK